MSKSNNENSNRGNQPALLDPERLAPGADNVLSALTVHRIALANEPEIAVYLTDHPDLAKIVPSVGARLREEFGKDAQLTLRLYADPEIDDRYVSLNVR